MNELEPDIVIISGDLTGDGLRGEFQLAAEYLERIECERLIVIRESRLAQRRLRALRGAVRRPPCGVAPGRGLDRRGRLDRAGPRPRRDRARALPWIVDRFSEHEAFLRIFVLHHHLLPVPGTGRERNVVHDAGDTLECLQRADVHLVLSGHKHVPYAWRLENLFVVNAGTVSTTRLRGKTKPCYNLIEASEERVTVYRKYPFHEQDAIISFDPRIRVREGPGAAWGDAHG